MLLTMPKTIDVLVTGQSVCTNNMVYTREAVDFQEYVKDVLPNEWGNNWDEESLRAGAVAVKMYAWSMHRTYGYVWDCNWNQVYRQGWRSEATDQAVEDTWDWIIITDSLAPLRTYYDDHESTCSFRGQPDNCMGQWDSLYLAEGGWTWKEILRHNYDGVLVRLP